MMLRRNTINTALNYILNDDVIGLAMYLREQPGFDLNQPRACKSQNTLLHDAIRYSQIRCVNFLLQQGAYLNVVNAYGNTPLISAVLQEDFSMVTLLLKTLRARGQEYLTSVLNNKGESALEVAKRKQNTKIARLLLSQGVAVYPFDHQDEMTCDKAGCLSGQQASSHDETANFLCQFSKLRAKYSGKPLPKSVLAKAFLPTPLSL